MAAIILENPGVIQPTSGATYPIFWLSRFVVNASNPNSEVNINANIDKMRVVSVDDNGNPASFELMPGGTQEVRIENFFATATPSQLAIAQSLLEMMHDIIEPPVE